MPDYHHSSGERRVVARRLARSRRRDSHSQVDEARRRRRRRRAVPVLLGAGGALSPHAQVVGERGASPRPERPGRPLPVQPRHEAPDEGPRRAGVGEERAAGQVQDPVAREFLGGRRIEIDHARSSNG